MKIEVLDHGYVEFIEAWGHGKAGEEFLRDYSQPDFEVGIIEAARQSTQGSFRGWDPAPCDCGQLNRTVSIMAGDEDRMEGFQAPHTKECNSVKDPGDRKLLHFLHNNKHSTPFEFSGMTLEIQAPIFVFREWHRHRTQSYSEASARYAPLGNLNYIPDIERVMIYGGGNKQAGALKGANELTGDEAGLFCEMLDQHYDTCQTRYELALSKGVPKELARLVLPMGRYSKMRASANLRNWLQFLTLRLDPAAQYEIRQYAQAVNEIIQAKFPQTGRLFSEEAAYREATKAELRGG